MTAALIGAICALVAMSICFACGKAGILFGLTMALACSAELCQAFEERRNPTPLVVTLAACGALWTALAWLGLYLGVLVE